MEFQSGIAIGVLLLIFLAGLGVAVLLLCLSALFLLVGAMIANIERASFGKAMLVTFISYALSILLSLLGFLIPVIGTLIGWGAGFITTGLIAMVVFETSFLRGLLAAMIQWLCYILFFGGLILVFIVLGVISWGIFLP